MAAAMEFDRAQTLSLSDKIDTYQQILNKPAEANDEDEESLRIKEQSILELGTLLQQQGDAKELGTLVTKVRPFLKTLSKAKAAKLIRTLVDLFLDMETSSDLEVHLCLECIEWAKEEKRTFLRQALEARLTALYFDTGRYQDALKSGSVLLRELKKLDDKQLLVEVQLTESRVYHALGNLQKSKAALTSARTTANSMYCPPKMQASLDLQSGILNAAEEKDWKTAYSYFYEAFEGYDSIDSMKKAVQSLRYMLLCKVMLGAPEEVQHLMSGKLALKYRGKNVEAMQAVAKASHNRSISELKEVVVTYKDDLENDPIIQGHLGKLYDNLLEKNLLRVIETFSKVQVDHIAKLINLPLETVEKKLSQMILDKKFYGILSQGEGVLILFDDVTVDKTYETALEVISSMSLVVDSLYHKAKQLT